MSALGHKQTCAVQKVMSALGQKRTYTTSCFPKFQAMDHLFPRKGIDCRLGGDRQNAIGQRIEPYQVGVCESLMPRYVHMVDDLFVIDCVCARIGNQAIEKA
jgi:hypothetical protein